MTKPIELSSGFVKNATAGKAMPLKVILLTAEVFHSECSPLNKNGWLGDDPGWVPGLSQGLQVTVSFRKKVSFQNKMPQVSKIHLSLHPPKINKDTKKKLPCHDAGSFFWIPRPMVFVGVAAAGTPPKMEVNGSNDNSSRW